MAELAAYGAPGGSAGRRLAPERLPGPTASGRPGLGAPEPPPSSYPVLTKEGGDAHVSAGRALCIRSSGRVRRTEAAPERRPGRCALARAGALEQPLSSYPVLTKDGGEGTAAGTHLFDLLDGPGKVALKSMAQKARVSHFRSRTVSRKRRNGHQGGVFELNPLGVRWGTRFSSGSRRE